MAHFAKISEENIVLSVMMVDDKDTLNADGVEDESVGQQYLETHCNWPAHLWIKTSWSTFENTHTNGGTPFRGNFAGVGNTWDSANQIFWKAKPYPSWVQDTTTASWKSPIGDAPELTAEEVAAQKHYAWNEANQSWDLTNINS